MTHLREKIFSMPEDWTPLKISEEIIMILPQIKRYEGERYEGLFLVGTGHRFNKTSGQRVL